MHSPPPSGLPPGTEGQEAGPKPPDSLRGGVGRDALPSPAKVVVVWVEAAFQ